MSQRTRPLNGIDDSTTELIVKANLGDRSAENEIVRRNLPAFRRWARGRLPRAARERGDTEDLVQEVFLHAIRRLRSFDPSGPGAFQAYLRRSMHNRVCDEVRRTRVRPRQEGLADTADEGPSPFDIAVAKETQTQYRTALGRLRPSDRALVVARVERQWAYERIATARRKPSTAAARVAVGRALRRLMLVMRGEEPYARSD